MSTVTVTPEQQKTMNKAKVLLLQDRKVLFFVNVFLNVKHLWSNDLPTAATNGTTIWYNPTFWDTLNGDHHIFLILHETMHIAYMHMGRLRGKNTVRWNKATDYVINAMLIKMGYVMPPGGLYDPQYDGMSAEEVYRLLPDEQDNGDGTGGADGFPLDILPPGEGDGKGSDQKGQDKASGTPDPNAAANAQAEIEQILLRARAQTEMQEGGKQAGSMPNDVRRYLDELITPKLPWHKQLRRYMTAASKVDYTFRKPNRRFFPDHILPSLSGEGLGRIGIAYDFSGSVDKQQGAIYVSETIPILKFLRPKKLNLLQFDTRILDNSELKSVHDLRRMEFRGFGGTRPECVLRWAVEKKPDLLLIFTDGLFGTENLTKPRCPVIWVITRPIEFNPPFGKVIYYEEPLNVL